MAKTIDTEVKDVRGPTVDMAKGPDGIYQTAKSKAAGVGRAVRYTGYALMLTAALGLAGMIGGCATAKKVNDIMMRKVGPIIPNASRMYYKNTATGRVTSVAEDPVLQKAYVECRNAEENQAFWEKRGSDIIYINDQTNRCLKIDKGYVPARPPRK